MSTVMCIPTDMRVSLSASFERPISSASKHIYLDQTLRALPINLAKASPQAFVGLANGEIN